jgi:hypothetical protein
MIQFDIGGESPICTANDNLLQRNDGVMIRADAVVSGEFIKLFTGEPYFEIISTTEVVI